MMRKLFAFLAAVSCGLLAGSATAQMAGEEAKTCAPDGRQLWSPGLERDNLTKHWPQESERYKANAQNVSRQGDRLRLALDGGKTVELMDCPYHGDGYQYLYDRYDQPGPFYVISTREYEDFYYTLVMRRNGRLFTVYGSPIWSSDKARFLTVACTLHPTRSELSIYIPSGDGLVRETAIDLPCTMESCSARWDFQSWVSVTCTPRDAGKKGTEFVVIRGNDGAWKRFGR
jgi:hypothetical protein